MLGDNQKNRCQLLAGDLIELKRLRIQFVRAYTLAVQNGDFSACKYLQQRIKELIKDPDSLLNQVREGREVHKLKLKEQYESQLRVAWRSGFFKKSTVSQWPQKTPLHGLPMIERDDEKYVMPSWPKVHQAIIKNRDLIKEKSRQGFTKMLIVPFGYDLKTMVGKWKNKLFELDQQGIKADGTDDPDKGVFNAQGQKIQFERKNVDGNYFVDYPIGDVMDSWDEKKLLYYPGDNNGGNKGENLPLSKNEVIKINGAWQICFVEDLPVIPDEGLVVGGRKQIDRHGSCRKEVNGYSSVREFMDALNDKNEFIDPEKYAKERGMTPEEYIWLAVTYLLEKEKPLMLDYENWFNRGGIFLVGCCYAKEKAVPAKSWQSQFRHIQLESVDFAFATPDGGIRTIIQVKPA